MCRFKFELCSWNLFSRILSWRIIDGKKCAITPLDSFPPCSLTSLLALLAPMAFHILSLLAPLSLLSFHHTLGLLKLPQLEESETQSETCPSKHLSRYRIRLTIVGLTPTYIPPAMSPYPHHNMAYCNLVVFQSCCWWYTHPILFKKHIPVNIQLSRLRANKWLVYIAHWVLPENAVPHSIHWYIIIFPCQIAMKRLGTTFSYPYTIHSWL